MTRHLPEQTRREQILAAARKCFIERGYHPTRMEDIASAASLSKGGVYFHFESKREVFDTLVQEEFDESKAFLAKVGGTDAPLAEKMQVIAAHYLEFFSTTRDSPRFLLVVGEMGLRDEGLAKRLLEMQSLLIDEVGRLIQQGIDEGLFREVDAKTTAALLKSMLDGIELLSAMEYPVQSSDMLTTGLDMVLHGLMKKPD